MSKVHRLIASVALIGAIGVPLGVSAAAHAASMKDYPRGHAMSCKTGYAGKTWRGTRVVEMREHGKLVRKRVVYRHVECVLIPHILTLTAPPTTTAPVTTSPAPAPAPVTVTSPVLASSGGGSGSGAGGSGGIGSGGASTSVRAAIDPTYTLDAITPAPPPVPVTFTYDASATGATLPDGTLTLTIYVHGSVSSAGGCQANVGWDLTPSGTPTDPVSCQVSLPAWGSYDLLTSYSGGGGVAATGETDTIDVAPPAPATVTDNMTWGISATSTVPSSTISVIGSTADVSVTDANWAGLSSVPLTATASSTTVGTCTATISGTSATCSMPITGTPNSLSVAFPGNTVVTTAPYTGWGISQTQETDYAWVATNVSVTPSVTVQTVTVGVGSYMISATNSGVTDPNAPASPLAVPTGDNLRLSFTAVGSLSTDTDPSGSALSVSVTGGTVTTTNDGTNGSTDCSNLTGNLSGQVSASTACTINFPNAGTYEVTVGFSTTDSNYGSEPSAYRLQVVVS